MADMRLEEMVEDGGALLIALDAVVRGRKHKASREGRICICVRGDKHDYYWAAAIGPASEHGFVDAIPPATDAILLLAKTDADALLKTGALKKPSSLASIGGDAQLIAAFIEEHASHASWLDVRARTPKKNAAQEKRRNR
jgi:hypothetical protein